MKILRLILIITPKYLLSIAFAIIVLLSSSMPAHSDAEDDLINALMTKIAGNDFLTKVLGRAVPYQGMTPKGGCTDSIGFGARCPRTTVKQESGADSAVLSIMDDLRGELNVKLIAALEASSLNTAEMYYKLERKWSASHDHQTCSTPGAQCDSSFLARIDEVDFRYALYNSRKVNLSITTHRFGDFKAQVKESEGRTYDNHARICGWRKHNLPLECSPCDRRREPTPGQ